MDRYYYLASTLLTPVFGQKPPLKFSELKELCSRLATAQDRRMLEAVSIAPPGSVEADERPVFEFQKEFWKRETALRNELARLRAEKLERRAEGQPRENGVWDNEAMLSARRAMEAEDPLQAELSLDKDRWDWIEAESAGHRFDEMALAAYALKTVILERLARFTEEAGVERYDSMYQKIFSSSERLAAYEGAS